ncbi:MAG: permease [Brevinematales bacterium]
MLKFDMFAINTVAVILDALPFLLAGSIIGTLIEIFLPEKLFRHKIFTRGAPGFIIALLLGMLFPTCECGVIPIARKFAKKGLPQHLAVVYMLAAPVINPIVIISTFIAFRFSILMVAGRMAVSAAAAVAIGLALSGTKDIFRTTGVEDHDHDCFCGTDEIPAGERLPFLVKHSAGEFLEMSKYLIAGAILASAFRIFAPKSVSIFFEQNIALSVLFMMALAVMLSICSGADAFVASSFMKFSPFAQLAFVTIGPVLGLKSIIMYSGTLKRRGLVLIAVISAAFVFLITNIIALIAGQLL